MPLLMDLLQIHNDAGVLVKQAEHVLGGPSVKWDAGYDKVPGCQMGKLLVEPDGQTPGRAR